MGRPMLAEAGPKRLGELLAEVESLNAALDDARGQLRGQVPDPDMVEALEAAEDELTLAEEQLQSKDTTIAELQRQLTKTQVQLRHTEEELELSEADVADAQERLGLEQEAVEGLEVLVDLATSAPRLFGGAQMLPAVTDSTASVFTRPSSAD